MLNTYYCLSWGIFTFASLCCFSTELSSQPGHQALSAVYSGLEIHCTLCLKRVYLPLWKKNFIRHNSKKKVSVGLLDRNLFKFLKFFWHFMMTWIAAIFWLPGQYFDFLGGKTSKSLINHSSHVAQKALVTSPHTAHKWVRNTAILLTLLKKQVGRNFSSVWFLYQISDRGSITILYSSEVSLQTQLSLNWVSRKPAAGIWVQLTTAGAKQNFHISTFRA